MEKETYKKIVKFTLESMKALSLEDRRYNLNIDLEHYYMTKIAVDQIITLDEFNALCREVGV